MGPRVASSPQIAVRGRCRRAVTSSESSRYRAIDHWPSPSHPRAHLSLVVVIVVAPVGTRIHPPLVVIIIVPPVGTHVSVSPRRYCAAIASAMRIISSSSHWLVRPCSPLSSSSSSHQLAPVSGVPPSSSLLLCVFSLSLLSSLSPSSLLGLFHCHPELVLVP